MYNCLVKPGFVYMCIVITGFVYICTVKTGFAYICAVKTGFTYMCAVKTGFTYMCTVKTSLCSFELSKLVYTCTGKKQVLCTFVFVLQYLFVITGFVYLYCYNWFCVHLYCYNWFHVHFVLSKLVTLYSLYRVATDK